MEAAPSNGELHMASVWRSRSGLIRVEHDYALPAMELPFEPLKTVKKKILTLKTVLFLALSFLKRVGDLQALSISPSYMEDSAPTVA